MARFDHTRWKTFDLCLLRSLAGNLSLNKPQVIRVKKQDKKKRIFKHHNVAGPYLQKDRTPTRRSRTVAPGLLHGNFHFARKFKLQTIIDHEKALNRENKRILKDF